MNLESRNVKLAILFILILHNVLQTETISIQDLNFNNRYCIWISPDHDLAYFVTPHPDMQVIVWSHKPCGFRLLRDELFRQGIEFTIDECRFVDIISEDGKTIDVLGWEYPMVFVPLWTTRITWEPYLPPVEAGDFDDDGDVDQSDFGLLQRELGTYDTFSSSKDMNGDHFIDQLDMEIWIDLPHRK